MEYMPTRLKQEIIIRNIVTLHYFEYNKDYVFTGENHDFWEMVYVDKGSIDIIAEKNIFRLNQGEIAFHKPNEFHNVCANGQVAPNLVIISFVCKSKAMSFFEKKVLTVTSEQKNFLSNIMKETTLAFSSPLGDPFTKELARVKAPIFGAEQMILLNLTQFLISMYRTNSSQTPSKMSLSALSQNNDNSMIENILEYLDVNIGQALTFDDIRMFFGLSGTTLKKVFKERFDMGVMQYYNILKIQHAKKLIREGNYNLTQIAELLGFDSIHYFSRKFKKITGMTPTEYTHSVGM
ncbi:MAG: AraC family transcriptional regulator [Oscillospiraceae bacterium]